MAEITTHEIGLSRLKATLEKLKTLDESVFDYSDFVAEFDYIEMCPTVGCVAGYLPFWFSDTPFTYIDVHPAFAMPQYKLAFQGKEDFYSIMTGLEEYYLCNRAIVQALFFGCSLDEYLRGINILQDASLRDVQNRFKILIDLVENCTISWN